MTESTALPPRGTIGAALEKKLFRRLIPLLILPVMLNYIDRLNIGFAALQMNGDLGFTPEVYGLGAAIFFVGYMLTQIPANLAIDRYGARRMIMAIMIASGALATAMAAIWNASSFYALRFLLAVAEAGMIPGATFYFTQWFPQRQRARAVAVLYNVASLAVLVGAPISGFLLELPPWLGLRPWQWLFILEGIPPIVFAFVIGGSLPDRLDDAPWLDGGERERIRSVFAQERSEANAATVGRTTSTVVILTRWRTWVLFLAFLCAAAQFFALTLWLPQIIHQVQNLRPMYIGLLTAAPELLSIPLTYLSAWHSDRVGLHLPHIIGGLLLAGAGCACSAWLTALPVASLLALTLGICGVSSLIGPFWSFATSTVEKRPAALLIALLSTGGSLGGFLMTYLFGELRQHSGNFEVGLYLAAALSLIGALLIGLVSRERATTSRPASVSYRDSH
jgi:MFS transporter, ACS family, tartrate transporter